MKNKQTCLSCAESSLKPLCEACEDTIARYSLYSFDSLERGFFSGSIPLVDYDRAMNIYLTMQNHPDSALTNHIRIHCFHKKPNLTIDQIMLSGSRKRDRWDFERYLTNGRYADRLSDATSYYRYIYDQRDIDQARKAIFSFLLGYRDFPVDQEYAQQCRKNKLARLRYTLQAIQESVKIDSLNPVKEIVS